VDGIVIVYLNIFFKKRRIKMKNIIISALLTCLFVVPVSSSFSAEKKKSELTRTEAAFVVIAHIYDADDLTYLSPLDENLTDECRMTSEEIDVIIKNYARKYYGGNSRESVADAIQYIWQAMLAMVDGLEGNGDGAFNGDEPEFLAEIIEDSEQIRILYCLEKAYREL
jgi:hypothetical protein